MFYILRPNCLGGCYSKDWVEGTLGLIDWLKKASPYYQNVKTIQRWFAEIVGYFESEQLTE